MPQVFLVLRCYKCEVFQVHQRKKINKWECKICGEKQSVKRYYCVGTAQNCRQQVQKLNGIRGEIDDQKQSESDDDDDKQDVKLVENLKPKKSKWSEYTDKSEKITVIEPNEAMYLNDREVVLEIPNKRQKMVLKDCFKTKSCTKFSIKNIKQSFPECNTSFKPECSENISYGISSSGFKNKNLGSELIESHYANKSCPPLITNDDVTCYKPAQKHNTNKIIPKFAPPTIKSHSKWGKFVDIIENEDESKIETELKENPLTLFDDNMVGSNIDTILPGNPMKLFSLCDDNELDIVLDI